MTDGTSQTLFVGEKLNDGLDLGWASGTRASLQEHGIGRRTAARPGPRPAGPRLPRLRLRERPLAITMKRERNPAYVGGFGSRHPGGSNFLFGDGSVRFIKSSIGVAVYQHLANRADGEVIDADQY